MNRPLAIGTAGKTILRALKTFGKQVTFSQILTSAGLSYDNSKLVEIANKLESHGLIQSVTYSLPLEIRAELSQTGEALVNALQQKTA